MDPRTSIGPPSPMRSADARAGNGVKHASHRATLLHRVLSTTPDRKRATRTPSGLGGLRLLFPGNRELAQKVVCGRGTFR
jgi:hypothetical protein